VAVSFQQLWSRLMGDIPGLPLARAQQCVGDAWRDLCESRLWSFNLLEQDLATPGLISAGTCTVTPFSTSVVGDATASTAWTALVVNYPINTLIFRVNLGELFNIVSFDGVSTLTLDRPYQPLVYPSTVLSGQGYQIYRAYFTMTPTDGSTFLAFDSVLDPIIGYRFKRLGLTKADIDLRDPLRNSFQNPVLTASYKPDLNGNFLWEFWPHQQASTPYLCLGRTNGKPLVNANDTIPVTLSRELIADKALMRGLEWALLNQSQIPGGDRLRIREVMATVSARYADELIRFSVADDERVLSYFVKYEPGNYYPGLLTGSWLAAHDGLGVLYGWPGSD
jgi:hypothetical protein